MKDDFTRAKRVLRTSGHAKVVEAVNGCCYGRDNKPDKGTYSKLCGEAFWEFVSGRDGLYLDIIEPLGHQAKQRNEAFLLEYGKVINLFTKQFIEEFCDAQGQIEWQKLVRFNSGKKAEKRERKKRKQ